MSTPVEQWPKTESPLLLGLLNAPSTSQPGSDTISRQRDVEPQSSQQHVEAGSTGHVSPAAVRPHKRPMPHRLCKPRRPRLAKNPSKWTPEKNKFIMEFMVNYYEKNPECEVEDPDAKAMAMAIEAAAHFQIRFQIKVKRTAILAQLCQLKAEYMYHVDCLARGKRDSSFNREKYIADECPDFKLMEKAFPEPEPEPEPENSQNSSHSAMAEGGNRSVVTQNNRKSTGRERPLPSPGFVAAHATASQRATSTSLLNEGGVQSINPLVSPQQLNPRKSIGRKRPQPSATITSSSQYNEHANAPCATPSTSEMSRGQGSHIRSEVGAYRQPATAADEPSDTDSARRADVSDQSTDIKRIMDKFFPKNKPLRPNVELHQQSVEPSASIERQQQQNVAPKPLFRPYL